MTPLFAHHVELQHYPVLIGLFAAGCWLGWDLAARWLGQLAPPAER